MSFDELFTNSKLLSVFYTVTIEESFLEVQKNFKKIA